MREIKFRVWDILNKEWATSHYFKINCNGQVYSENQLNITDRYILEQYTGLRDSTNTDAYYKDIISANGYSNWIIEWHNNGWKLKQFDTENYIEIPDSFVIIGNIHENPELLQGGKQDAPN